MSCRFLVTTTCLLSLLIAPAFAATKGDPALQITKPIYAWKTESDYNKKENKFDHCLVKNMFDNGTIMMLAQNADGVQRLALDFPQDKMQTGQHFDLTLQIDKRDLFPVEAIAVSSKILTIGIPEALPDQMRKGQALYLRGPNDEVVYMLDGMNGAVAALRDCMITSRQGGPVTPEKTDDAYLADAGKQIAIPSEKSADKVKSPEPIKLLEAEEKKSAKPEEAKSAEKPVEKTEQKPVDVKVADAVKPAPVAAPVKAPEPVLPVPTNPVAATPVPVKPAAAASAKPPAEKLPILSQEKKIETYQPLLPERLDVTFAKAGLTPEKLLSTPVATQGGTLGSTSSKPIDYAWIKNGLFIGVKEQPSVPLSGLSLASARYMKIMKDRCTGPFVAEAAEPKASAKINWQIAEIACSPGKTDDTIGALLFATDADRMTIYFIEAPVKKGGEALKARDALLNALTK